MTDRFTDRSLALVLWAEKGGEDDVAVLPGIFREIDERYFLEHAGEPNLLDLSADWVSRIKEVPAELQEVLCGCELQLSLTVADIEDEDAEGYTRLGLKWPE